MKSNITLVGMPASGKSTIGVLLAKRLGYSFVDVDIVIQEKTGQLLKEIIAERGTEGFLKVEESVNAELETERSVIAPGGSVIYGPKAMEHLHEISTVVYLKLSYEDVKQRLGPDPVCESGKPGIRHCPCAAFRCPPFKLRASHLLSDSQALRSSGYYGTGSLRNPPGLFPAKSHEHRPGRPDRADRYRDRLYKSTVSKSGRHQSDLTHLGSDPGKRKSA